MNNTKYWIWLSLAMGVASTAPHRLLEHFDGDIQRIYAANSNELRSVRLTDRQHSALLDKSTDESELIVDWCANHNVKILCYDDPAYPKRLAQIPDAPIVLYYIGNLYPIDDSLCLAAVGTRDMSRYGHDTAYAFCHDLARGDAIIVSGLAAGIDSTAHRAVLDAGGKTVAVLGCRISKVYPPENRSLMVEIARKGLILTEYHPFHKTSPANFPKRNRIISGLCQGTIVFEADEGSGSLITARMALKQGRRIYALPGNIGNSGSTGTNTLISNGAKIITRSSDIINEYLAIYPELKKLKTFFEYTPTKHPTDSFAEHKRQNTPKSEAPSQQQAEKPKPDSVDLPVLSDPEKCIYEQLSYDEPISYDALTQSFSDAQMLSALTMLELKGLITAVPGNKFIRKNHN